MMDGTARDVHEADSGHDSDPPSPLGDADGISRRNNHDDEVLTSSESKGADLSTSPSTLVELDENKEDTVTSLEIEVGDGRSNSFATSIDDHDEQSLEDDTERVIIVPNFVGDPIILHVNSKQAKPTPKDGLPASKQVNEDSNGQHMPTQILESNDSTSSSSKSNTAVDVVTVDGEKALTRSDIHEQITVHDTKENTVVEIAPRSSENPIVNAESTGDIITEKKQVKLVDYASKLAGAQILEHSPSLKGASNLLTGDKDRYSIAPCEDDKYVVIGLSEDILVKKIKLSNYERYSSRLKKFQVLASQEYPTLSEEQWNSVGTYEAHSKSGEQVFELENPTWARYLQFRFVSHYGSEHYCTLSQIKVHGSTMLQGFHEQWAESEKKDLELETADKTVENVREESMERDYVEGQDISVIDVQQVQSKDMARENAPHMKAEDNIMGENRIDKGKDSADADQQDQREFDGVTGQKSVEEEATIESYEKSTQEVMNSEYDGGNHLETSIIHNIAQARDESSPENSNSELLEILPLEGNDTEVEKASKDLNELHETGDISDEESVSIAPGEEKYNPPSEVWDAIKAIQIGDDDNGRVSNDSSIIKVTDVVKTVVSDASDVIKNATRETIKNVKDAILTSVTTTKVENSAIQEGLGNHSEKLDILEPNKSDQERSIEHGMTSDSTSQDYAKPKNEGGSMQLEDVTDASSNLDQIPINSKRDSKAASGRDLLQRTITLGKEVDATNLVASLSRRFPSASCLKDLDFQSFKAKVLLASGGHGGSLGGGIKMEPIFTKITHEIKSVQNTQYLYEQYTIALKNCYESLFRDVATEMDTMHTRYDMILSRLDGNEEEHNRSNEVLSKFYSTTFQPGSHTKIPMQTTVLCAIATTIFLFVVKSFIRCSRIRRGRGGCNQNMNNNIPSLVDPIKKKKHVLVSLATDVPDLTSDTDLLEEKLTMVKAQLLKKDEKIRSLQVQHTSLQQKCSELERTISALECTIEKLTPAKNIVNATRNGYTTPPPTFDNELLSSGITTISPTEDTNLKEQVLIEKRNIDNA